MSTRQQLDWVVATARRAVVAACAYIVVCWTAVALATAAPQQPAAAQLLETWDTYAFPIHALALLAAASAWVLGRMLSKVGSACLSTPCSEDESCKF